MNIGRVPGVRSIDVVGTGRRGADEIGHGPEQDVVARARPRIVEEDGVLRTDAGVVEQVEAGPTLARLHTEARQRIAEVVRTIGMARIALVLVELRIAGQAEGVVAAD